MARGFVRRPESGGKVWLYSAPEATQKNQVRDARWGDYLNHSPADEPGWRKIKWGDETYFIEESHIAPDRPLEMIFVDVGQGDGCILVSPEVDEQEKIVLIDAGPASNMFNFVKWRFGKLENTFRFHAAVITHSDLDHYRGFQKLFTHENVEFEHVFHNGLVERTGDDLLGASDSSGDYITGLVQTNAQMKQLMSNEKNRGAMKYPELMDAALTSTRVGAITMLSTQHGTVEEGRTWLPGFAPSDGEASIEVVGPVVETLANGKKALRWFGDKIGAGSPSTGKTKNGHSVLLRLTIGELRILFGGDLNKPAEDFLLRHYGEIEEDQPLKAAVATARERLSADILKSCHHGSADVTDEFLRAVDPFAFVVSSGDAEMHAHPRPDLLGRLGKNGRGSAPLIFCTEILRSTREKGKADDFLRLRKLDALIDSADTSDADRKKYRKDRKELQAHIERRNVGVYGAITMRTDGAHLHVSHRLESPNKKRLWQTYEFVHSGGQWKPAGGGGGH
jgi:beta-lactamase superfamily II metal-dependent hydrolase